MKIQHKSVFTLIVLIISIMVIAPVSADPLADCLEKKWQTYQETFGKEPSKLTFNVMYTDCSMEIYGVDPFWATLDEEGEIDPEGIPSSPDTYFTGGWTYHDPDSTSEGGEKNNSGEGDPAPTATPTPTPSSPHNHKVITCPNCGEKMIVCPTCNTVIPLVTPPPKSNNGK